MHQHRRKPLKLAYLVSEYPAISHTFILREIASLRNLSASIYTASINEPNVPVEQMGLEEQQEHKTTFYVKKQGKLKAIWIFFKNFATNPLAILKGMGFASKLAGWNLKSQIYHQFYIAEALLIKEWLSQNNLKHIHVHFANPASTVALLLNKIFSIPFSITVHGPDEFYNVKFNLLKEKMMAAAFVCCISDYAKSQLMRLTPSENWHKFETTPLGVNPLTFLPRRPMPGNRPFQLICVGRLVPSKGQQLLIFAMHLLSLQGKNIHLKLVGDGPDRTIIEKQIRNLQLEKHVRLLGSLPQSAVIHEYQQADLFVLTSFAEGVPVVLMEAMSMEIPCIAPKIHGIPELIREGTDGILFTPANVDELTNAIAAMIHHPERRERLGKSGRRRILEKYCLERNAQSLYNIFSEHWSD